jgi:hypothetical protein
MDTETLLEGDDVVVVVVVVVGCDPVRTRR